MVLILSHLIFHVFHLYYSDDARELAISISIRRVVIA